MARNGSGGRSSLSCAMAWLRLAAPGSPALTNLTFSQNSGGMRNDHSHPTLTTAIFRDNAGSGMHIVSSRTTLKAVSFINNSAHDGGGMYNE